MTSETQARFPVLASGMRAFLNPLSGPLMCTCLSRHPTAEWVLPSPQGAPAGACGVQGTERPSPWGSGALDRSWFSSQATDSLSDPLSSSPRLVLLLKQSHPSLPFFS